MSKQFKRTPVKGTRVSYNYRPDTSLHEEEQLMYRRVYGTLIVIVLLAVGLYFWGVDIVGALGGFLSYTNTNDQTIVDDTTQTSGQPIIPPRIDPIPMNLKETSIDIRGWAQEGVEVKLYRNDEVVATLLSDKNGRFEATGITLVSGQNVIYGTADIGGQLSQPSEKQTIVVDNEKPKLDVSVSDPNSESKVEVKGTTDPSSTITINDSRAIVQNDGSFSYFYSVQPGENHLKIKAEDLAGNVTEVEKTVNFSPSPTPASE
ncbi:hypothetical protein HGA91_02865 [candidate division WWE3 bacterium]|nr:hypothetical protein [candidate division WWE3 bacterium]